MANPNTPKKPRDSELTMQTRTVVLRMALLAQQEFAVRAGDEAAAMALAQRIKTLTKFLCPKKGARVRITLLTGEVAEGTVFWVGPSKLSAGTRCGVSVGDQTFWADAPDAIPAAEHPWAR